MLNHITLQHGHLFKSQRKRRLRKIAIPSTQSLSLLGRDLCEAHLQVLLGGSGSRSSNTSSSSNATNDPLLLSLIMNFSSSESEDISKFVLACAEYSSSKREVPSPIWKARERKDDCRVFCAGLHRSCDVPARSQFPFPCSILSPCLPLS